MALLNADELYRIHEGDCIPHLASLPAASVDFAITSVPFPAVFSYTSKSEDIGNSENYHEMKIHLGYLYRQMIRVMKPGRAFVVHVNQIVRMKRSGGEGVFDFRGFNIRLSERCGFTFEYDWVGHINPQAQALTTRSRSLQFAGLESNRAESRGALPDYFLKFSAPGECAVPVRGQSQVSRNEWIEWAECMWRPSKVVIDLAGTKSMTLNTEVAKGPDDTRHICPFNLSYVERMIRLFTNPGEIVLDPFTGIGSVGFIALRRGRRFYGAEINPLYVKAAHENLARALAMNAADEQPSLLDLCGVESEAETVEPAEAWDI